MFLLPGNSTCCAVGRACSDHVSIYCPIAHLIVSVSECNVQIIGSFTTYVKGWGVCYVNHYVRSILFRLVCAPPRSTEHAIGKHRIVYRIVCILCCAIGSAAGDAICFQCISAATVAHLIASVSECMLPFQLLVLAQIQRTPSRDIAIAG